MSFWKGKKGFTLIELLIVITILGILAATLVPRIIGAPAKARDSIRTTDLKRIVTALETYNAENGRYPASAGCVRFETGGAGNTTALGQTLSAYLGDVELGDPSGVSAALEFDFDGAGVIDDIDEICENTLGVDIGGYFYIPLSAAGNANEAYAIIADVELPVGTTTPHYATTGVVEGWYDGAVGVDFDTAVTNDPLDVSNLGDVTDGDRDLYVIVGPY